jgi:ribonuclease inhibitor
MKKVIIDGLSINNANDIYRSLKQQLGFAPYFANNIDALWDVLSTDVERPFVIHWINADVSQRKLGNDFNLFVNLFQRLEEYDRLHGWDDKFKFNLNNNS